MVGVWTMDDLLTRVHRALAAEYPGAPNGRVRELPDRRAVRWYTTTGLVDRPSGMRGRNAVYGRRHLLQIVAVKRRQAEGRSLAEIQAELAGATDDELSAVARVPESLLNGTPSAVDAAPARPRFWAATPAALPPPAPPAPLVSAQPAPAAPELSTGLRELGGIALGGGAILVLPTRPGESDLEAIADAAQPLLTLLAARGLLIDGSPA
ncbi:MerR family transcriptional regulator [Symbioplanes lichenis]|uniref:MerR family transcriptional regulator n=1 Tax=Symbioplanes lichenis TaxID=1629072 RepID=UPI00273913AA|nr:MerR family transcriptional regulator [Actinoplanes lichenis]